MSQEELLQVATASHKAGRLREAEEAYRRILSSNQSDPQANLLLGILLAQSDREPEAESILTQVAKQQPGNFAALSWLSGVLGTLKRFDEATDAAKRALAIRPDDVNTLLHLAAAEFGAGRYEEAAHAFLRVLKLAPKALPAYYGLSRTFIKLGQPLKARMVMNDAAQVSPDPETLMKFAEALLSCEMGEEALDVLNRILASQPENLDALLLVARAQRVARQDEAEQATVQAILGIAPDDYRSHTQKGRRLQRAGDFQEAEQEFLRSIELKPKQGVAYYGVVSCRKVTQGDEGLVDSMEALLGISELGEEDLTHLRYGLGKAYNDLGDYGRAMANYDEANRLVRLGRPSVQRFSPEAMRAHYELLPKLFTPASMEARRSQGPRNPQPVIVAGFMRSGTTLTEQILSRHPLIGAAGELPFWQDQEVRCIDHGKSQVDYKRLSNAGEEYEKLLAQVAPGFDYVTDKNPANHTSYGLIHTAFPDARIVHLERNPVDVAISVWTTMMGTAATFVNDKANVVLAIQLQRKLTEYWREALPQDRFKVVSYEALTADPEGVVKECLEFIGLEWSDECLSPERNTRLVSTPSLWQVRQPVYKSSVERWRRYEPWLGPFADLID